MIGKPSVRFGGRPRGKGPAQQTPRGAANPIAWIVNRRRLDHDDERLPAHSEAMIKWAMIGLMTRRRAPPQDAAWGHRQPLLEDFPNTFLEGVQHVGDGTPTGQRCRCTSGWGA